MREGGGNPRSRLVPPDQLRPDEKETQPFRARAIKAVWQRYLLGQSPLRGFSLAGCLATRPLLLSRDIS